MHNIKNSKDYSIAILTDCQGRVKMVLDIPNRMLNMPSGELKSYFQITDATNYEYEMLKKKSTQE